MNLRNCSLFLDYRIFSY